MVSEVPSSRHLPPLHLLREDGFCVSGKVTIHSTATIAPGVLLQADADGEITIAAGVCIGAGTILHVQRGMLEVEAEATLGAGVLVVGNGKIGRNACVGAKTLVWSSSIEADQVVPAGSLIGDSSGGVAPALAEAIVNPPASPLVENPPRGVTPIYGKAALDRLLTAMLPHRQPLSPANNLPALASEDTQPNDAVNRGQG